MSFSRNVSFVCMIVMVCVGTQAVSMHRGSNGNGQQHRGSFDVGSSSQQRRSSSESQHDIYASELAVYEAQFGKPIYQVIINPIKAKKGLSDNEIRLFFIGLLLASDSVNIQEEQAVDYFSDVEKYKTALYKYFDEYKKSHTAEQIDRELGRFADQAKQRLNKSDAHKIMHDLIGRISEKRKTLYLGELLHAYESESEKFLKKNGSVVTLTLPDDLFMGNYIGSRVHLMLDTHKLAEYQDFEYSDAIEYGRRRLHAPDYTVASLIIDLQNGIDSVGELYLDGSLKNLFPNLISLRVDLGCGLAQDRMKLHISKQLFDGLEQLREIYLSACDIPSINFDTTKLPALKMVTVRRGVPSMVLAYGYKKNGSINSFSALSYGEEVGKIKLHGTFDHVALLGNQFNNEVFEYVQHIGLLEIAYNTPMEFGALGNTVNALIHGLHLHNNIDKTIVMFNNVNIEDSYISSVQRLGTTFDKSGNTRVTVINNGNGFKKVKVIINKINKQHDVYAPSNGTPSDTSESRTSFEIE